MAAPERATPLPALHPAMLLATWFGAGLLPKAPGTWGSLAALPFAWLIERAWGPLGLVVAALAVFAVGCWAAGAVARGGGIADPGYIVIDEVAGQFLTLAAAPPGIATYLVGFALFRIADIVKPWPASWADRSVHGGFGIMLDDAIAAVYAALVLYLLTRSGLA